MNWFYYREWFSRFLYIVFIVHIYLLWLYMNWFYLWRILGEKKLFKQRHRIYFCTPFGWGCKALLSCWVLSARLAESMPRRLILTWDDASGGSIFSLKEQLQDRCLGWRVSSFSLYGQTRILDVFTGVCKRDFAEPKPPRHSKTHRISEN